jgi:cellobiose-specific phosphotransferase system component IIB
MKVERKGMKAAACSLGVCKAPDLGKTSLHSHRPLMVEETSQSDRGDAFPAKTVIQVGPQVRFQSSKGPRRRAEVRLELARA